MSNKKFIKEVGLFTWVTRTAIRQAYKRILKTDHSMRLPNGERFRLPRISKFATEAFITRGNVDWGSERLLYALLKRNGAFLDVGANIGYYSVYMRPKVKAIYCFEPDPRAFAQLEKNVPKNAEVHLVAAAMGETPGEARFTLAANTEISHLSKGGQDGITVQMHSVDSFVRDHGLAVEAIKVDVEGADMGVLRGAVETMKQQQPIVITESAVTAEFLQLIAGLPYRVFAYARHPELRTLSFVEIKAVAQADIETKMLFLLPDHRVDEAVRFATA